MTITTVIVADYTNPVEVQTWFNNNPLVVSTQVLVQGSIFYIIY
jgi:hypothetical protein